MFQCPSCKASIAGAERFCPSCGYSFTKASTAVPQKQSGGMFWKIALGVGCGIVLAFLLIMGACSACVGKAALNLDEQKRQKAETLSRLEIRELTSEVSGEYQTVRGKLYNGGNSPVTYVKVEIRFIGFGNQVVDKEWTYAVASDSLAPGEEKSFHVMCHTDGRSLDYQASVITD